MKRMRVGIVPLLVLTIAGCLGSPVPNSGGWHFTVLETPLEIVSVNGAEGVIIPPKLGPDVLKQCSRSAPSGKEGFWRPVTIDIGYLEEKLQAYVAAHPPQLVPDLAMKLSDYKRQYVGVIKKGKQVVYVNFFLWHESLARSLDWRKQAMLMCDGGGGFWGIEFDVGSGTFSNLFTNGII